MRSRIAATTGGHAEREHFRSQVEHAVATGDETTARIKRKVHARFLAGSQLQFDKVRQAIDDGDPAAELAWRAVLLKNQVKLEQFGASDPGAQQRLPGEIDANIAAMRAHTGRR